MCWWLDNACDNAMRKPCFQNAKSVCDYRQSNSLQMQNVAIYNGRRTPQIKNKSALIATLVRLTMTMTMQQIQMTIPVK